MFHKMGCVMIIPGVFAKWQMYRKAKAEMKMTEVNKMTKENGGERDAVIAECAGGSGVGQY